MSRERFLPGLLPKNDNEVSAKMESSCRTKRCMPNISASHIK